MEVENIGNEKAGGFKVAFHLSHNGVTLGDLLDEKNVTAGLGSGKSRTLSCRHESEESISGKYVIGVIDSDDQIIETDETNNRVKILVP